MSEWQDRVNVLRVEQSVSSEALAQYRNQGYEDAIRKQAAHALADRIIREGAVECAVQEPSEDEYTARTTYHYDVAVVMPDRGRSHFAEQLAAEREAGRQAGLAEAVAFVRSRASVMREVNGLIAFNIEAVASDLAQGAIET